MLPLARPKSAPAPAYVAAARGQRIALSLFATAVGAALWALSSIASTASGGKKKEDGGIRKHGVSVCLVYDGDRAESGLASILADLLRAIPSSGEFRTASVTALRLDGGGARGQPPLPTELAEATQRSGVRWVSLPPTQHTYDGTPAAAASFRALEWLRALAQPFDHIIFHSAGGAAYYPLLARELELALGSSRVSVVSLAPRQLLWRRRPGTGASLDDLEEDAMQRGVAQRADALVAPAAALRFMRAHGWRLPELSGTLEGGGEKAATDAAEHRQGGDDGAAYDGDGDDDGSEDGIGGGAGVAAASSGNTHAVRWWRQPRLLELWARLPPRHEGRHAFDAYARKYGARAAQQQLLRRLHRLEVDEAREAANRTDDKGRGGGGGLSGSGGGGSGGADGRPLVSVCVVHHERGPLLLQALMSIREQSLEPSLVQAVVVDDGSTSAAALAVLEKAGDLAEFRSGRWLLLRRPSRYLGASRNEAARHATGRFLYFLDDDNCLKRHTLLTLLAAAAASGAHVLTSVNEKWPSLERPPEADERSERWLPLGDAAAVGVFKNCFGDAAALVRRSAFEALGGFTEDGGVGHEDWELWARAVLRGYKLRVVPEALYWYRIGGTGSMLSESDSRGLTADRMRLARAQRHANHARNVRPYLQRLVGWPEAQELVRLAQGMYLAQT